MLGLVVGIWNLYLGFRAEENNLVEETKPTLPTISFQVQGFEVNELLPYVREMDISVAREWLTPLDAQGKIELTINDYGNDIGGASYQVSTLDGKRLLTSEELQIDMDGIVSLNLNAVTTNIVESVLNVKLVVNGEEVNYYTRLIGYDQLMLDENFKFVQSVHNATLSSDEWEYLDSILDAPVESNGVDLQNVNLNSSIEEIQWCNLEPTVIGDVKWRISEASSVYTGVELSYMVSINIENQLQYFLVEEYYRTSYSSSKSEVQLNDYIRTSTQIYEGKEENVEHKKLKIGINGAELDIIESDDQNIVVFSQGKELYAYNTTENSMVKIFGNYEWLKGAYDSRYFVNQRDVRAIDVDNDGNISFTVYGYVNSGENEGLVGTSIYYYDALDNSTTEKAFICTDKSYAQSKEELRNSTYYSTGNQEIYLIINQIIYAINLETMEKRQISQVLEHEEYVFSEDKGYIAFNSGEGDILSKLTVLSIADGEEYNVNGRENENIYPLGFVENDLVIGYARKEDTLNNYRGEIITPAYEVEVRNIENEVIKTYTQDKHFVEDVTVEERVVYLNQVTKKDGEYSLAQQEYIANNITVNESDIALTNGTDDILGLVKYITLKKTSAVEWKYDEAVGVVNHNKIIITYESNKSELNYHVYAYGKLYKSCKNLEEAIGLADTHYGYVLNANQGYIWRRGARALNYPSFALEDEIKSKLTSGEKVVEVVQNYAQNSLQNYTGLTLENMCYLINQDQVIGVELEDGTWGVLTGYTIDTIYYLDEKGTKRSGNINRLSGQIDTMIGNYNAY